MSYIRRREVTEIFALPINDDPNSLDDLVDMINAVKDRINHSQVILETTWKIEEWPGCEHLVIRLFTTRGL